jgi:aromatic ring-opening dioxygenase catalytic subunit (LigB family)
MPIIFAGACAHAPGITGWPQAAAPEQRERFHSAYHNLGERLRASRPETIVIFTSEHWANLFLNNYPAFCIGRAPEYFGPIEAAINIPQGQVPGDDALSGEILTGCYASGFEPSVSDELTLDHGTMVPLHFLIPERNVAVVPIVINSIAAPMPTPRRCFEFGKAVGAVLARSPKRIAVIGSGGLSHRPGTGSAGKIDQKFDALFLEAFCAGKLEELSRYTSDSIAPAGYGAQEIRNWLALAGAVGVKTAHVDCYEPVPGWATGVAIASVHL